MKLLWASPFSIRDKRLVQKRDLLWLITSKEITLKYKRTILGIFWSLLNPIILSFVLFVAFTVFLRIQIENYVFFVLSALFPWTWFSASVTLASGALVGNAQLLKKVRLPKYFFVIATVITQLLNLLFALPVILVLAYYYKTGPHLSWVWGIPILIFVELILTLGVSFMVSILNAYFRDMEYIVAVLINLLFWLTPIVYSMNMVPGIYKYVLFVNPLTYLITTWRELFMEGVVNWGSIGISFLTSFVVFLSGAFIFHILGRRFDEVV
jgi:lipopolysaccharide transport system permease protein